MNFLSIITFKKIFLNEILKLLNSFLYSSKSFSKFSLDSTKNSFFSASSSSSTKNLLLIFLLKALKDIASKDCALSGDCAATDIAEANSLSIVVS